MQNANRYAGVAGMKSPRVSTRDTDRTDLPDEARQPGRQMRNQAAVGVDALLDVGQIAALDDAVEPFGAADQHAGLAARQRVGDQFPGRLVERPAVEQFDIAGRMRQQQLDRLRLARVVGVVDEPPEARLAKTAAPRSRPPRSAARSGPPS